MVLAHNHSSGNLNPSQTDLQLTRKIKLLVFKCCSFLYPVDLVVYFRCYTH
ncbi:JAB domain-containing protein [Pontibacter indicus]|uniref:JAB domain-containing protein n=1 Tax=Pontibacter indicus TaxID=1317125 RepID=UPI0009FA0027|nr:JAB domain-containing protein [Pontibacter indicus]